MDRARMIIVGTVPITMVINLLLLNFFCGDKPELKNNQSLKVSNPVENTETIKTNTNYETPLFSKRIIKKNKTISYTKPPSHVFVEFNSSDVDLANEKQRSEGIIVK